jgi:uncharacterized protein YeaO (DUF488 family)
MNKILVKRVYDPPSDEDGIRLLVDRLWPRGISRQGARIDEWLRDIAPSDGLRKWYGHKPELFPEFVRKYRLELEDKVEMLDQIREINTGSNVTLLYSAKDRELNQAVVLHDFLLDYPNKQSL